MSSERQGLCPLVDRQLKLLLLMLGVAVAMPIHELPGQKKKGTLLLEMG